MSSTSWSAFLEADPVTEANKQTEETRIRELGFGKSANDSGVRLLNRDGSFNAERHGLSYKTSRSLYLSLVTMSWPKFFSLTGGFYLGTNILFATLYYLCGPDALSGTATQVLPRFLTAFFFSVQTLATIGYGQITPIGILPNVLVTFEAFCGLLGFSLITGFLFARISRPSARVVFSEKALIAPFENGTGFMFRLVNGRLNQLIEVEVRVVMSRMEGEGERRKREFYPLELEYSKVSFFSLSWTVVHPIVESSPLWKISEQELLASDAEFLILLTAIDDIFSQTVHARSSYKAAEVIWGARFSNIYEAPLPGRPIAIDVTRLSATELVQ